MRPALREVVLLACLAAPAAAAAVAGQIPVQQQVINLSLLEALVAVEATQLAGVFGFVPDSHSAMAMADYLMHEPRALKKFVKKVARDQELAQGINDWDRQVLLYLVGIDAAGVLPEGLERVPRRLMSRIQDLSLKQPLTLEVIQSRRAAKK